MGEQGLDGYELDLIDGCTSWRLLQHQVDHPAENCFPCAVQSNEFWMLLKDKSSDRV
jgi:hypothetical protein